MKLSKAMGKLQQIAASGASGFIANKDNSVMHTMVSSTGTPGFRTLVFNDSKTQYVELNGWKQMPVDGWMVESIERVDGPISNVYKFVEQHYAGLVNDRRLEVIDLIMEKVKGGVPFRINYEEPAQSICALDNGQVYRMSGAGNSHVHKLTQLGGFRNQVDLNGVVTMRRVERVLLEERGIVSLLSVSNGVWSTDVKVGGFIS